VCGFDYCDDCGKKTGPTFPEKEQHGVMATDRIALPDQLLAKVKKAAAQEEITPEGVVIFSALNFSGTPRRIQILNGQVRNR